MALVDHGAAWLDLAELVSSREGWGSRALLAEMQRLEAKHRLSETLPERMLRLYGDGMTIVVSTPEAPASGEGGNLPPPAAPVPGHRQTLGGHDGRSTPARAAV